MKTVSLTFANQNFSKVVGEVEHGEAFIITRRDRPIATLTPQIIDKTKNAQWQKSRSRLSEIMKEGASMGGLKVNREELYDR